MTRHRELELSDAAYRANPLIREAMAHVAHVPIRNRGTVVGSLCHADAAAEMPMVLLLTGGSVVAEGPSGRRHDSCRGLLPVPHDDVAASQDEVIVEARFPVLPEGAGYCLRRVHPPPRRLCHRRGRCDRRLRHRTAVRHRSAVAACGIARARCGSARRRRCSREAGLIGKDLEAAGEAAKEAVTAPDDMHATTDYRRHVLATLVRRARRDGRIAPEKDGQVKCRAQDRSPAFPRLSRTQGARLADA